MSRSDVDQIRFDTHTGQLIRRCLRVCHYHDDLIDENYPLATGRAISLVAFAHRPHDARSSCIAFLPESVTSRDDVASMRELGVPVTFFPGRKSWHMWSLRSDGPRHEQSVPTNEIEQFFDLHKSDFAPGAVFRAKTWARAAGARQLDFVDTGLLPLVETEAGIRLRQLFEDMVAHAMDALDMAPSGLSERDAHWLVRANFWLLAGKLLRDKQVPKFTQLDLHDVQNVFDLVADHYAAPRVRSNGRLTALRGAAAIAAAFSSLRSISTETLGALYEEALLSDRTRKLLSVHRTPTYLVDYILATLSRSMEDDVGIQNCRVFEPACGHAPFLVGAVRLLSDLLPREIASDRPARRQFLRKHIGGCDRDAFALEIARLSLTLADIPNPNGWQLDDVTDMFTGDYLERKIAANSIIIANPPFENTEISMMERTSGDLRYARSGQAGELLRRIVNHASDGTLFGIVVPQTLLDGASFRDLRRNLLTSVELREIVTFPDSVFKFAKPETALLIGQKLGEGKTGANAFKFRRIEKAEMDAFRNENRVPLGASFSRNDALAHVRHQLLLPRLGEVWEATQTLVKLQEVAYVTIGFYFYSETDPEYPKDEVQVSATKLPGFHQGFLLAEATPNTHLLPKLEWLNLKPQIIRRACGGLRRGAPRIVMNHVRTGASAWRHKAFIDQVGRPATDAFLLLSPLTANWSLEILWALANGPFANAFTLTNSAAKQIGVRLLQSLRVPVLQKPAHALEFAVQSYLLAARQFTATYENETAAPKQRTKAKIAPAIGEIPELELALKQKADEVGTAAHAQQRLRALHWRLDAELLKLYALPADLERKLLDFFDGVWRVGVPFEQKRYIPSGFRDVLRLDDFLRITDEWEQTDYRRCQLIEARIQRGRRTSDEEAEFKDLQRLFDLRRAYLRWSETGEAHGALFDEEKLKQLQKEDAGWREAE